MSDTGDELRAQLVGFFFEEAGEGLEIIEAGLVALDVANPDAETINAIFRAMHSLKGSSGSFGFTDISTFAHRAETLLDEIRDGSRSLDSPTIDLLLRATDCISNMLESIKDETEANPELAEALTVELQALLDASASPGTGSATQVDEVASDSTVVIDWNLGFSPHQNLLKTGNDPFRILRELGELGEMQVRCDWSSIPAFDQLDPEDCHLSWQIELRSDCSRDDIEEVFAWVEDECDLLIESRISQASQQEAGERRDAALAEHLGKPAANAGVVAGDRATDAAVKAGSSSSIRVGTEKVDTLMNMVGELVITQSMLQQIGEDFRPEQIDRLMDGLADLERNTRELQESVMKIRMLPISVTFARFPRLVRDISQALCKEVDLELRGEGTELDKTILEHIGDPLVHLVRNSLDHGLESVEERRAAGKPEKGTITLAAYHEGGCIVIDVKDDGRGLNHEKIRAQAIAEGLIAEDEPCDEHLIARLILGAGFSTAEQVSDVSGRGVGMDVVQRNIKKLGGTIGIQSVPGQGTTTTIRLPLTLAILDGQLIRVGSQIYVIPLTSIVESLQIKTENVNSIAGKVSVYRLREEAVPIIRLHQLFNIEPDTHELEGALLVVVEANGRKAGFVVDELHNQQQVVIKSLEANYKRVEGLSGATILGDGTVALIVDIGGLIDRAGSQGLFSREATVALRDSARAEQAMLMANDGANEMKQMAPDPMVDRGLSASDPH